METPTALTLYDQRLATTMASLKTCTTNRLVSIHRKSRQKSKT
jgi:hypothetical protein